MGTMKDKALSGALPGGVVDGECDCCNTLLAVRTCRRRVALEAFEMGGEFALPRDSAVGVDEPRGCGMMTPRRVGGGCGQANESSRGPCGCGQIHNEHQHQKCAWRRGDSSALAWWLRVARRPLASCTGNPVAVQVLGSGAPGFVTGATTELRTSQEPLLGSNRRMRNSLKAGAAAFPDGPTIGSVSLRVLRPDHSIAGRSEEWSGCRWLTRITERSENFACAWPKRT
jgi:hypothetical protein